MKIRKAIIPCAGYGTRFLPFTKAVPKELLPIVDTPALQFGVEEAVAAGIEEILVIINPQKHAIKEYFGDSDTLCKFLLDHDKTEEYAMLKNISNMAKVSYAVQSVMRGSGDALYYGREFVGEEPFAVLFGDDVIYTGLKPSVTKQLVDAYEHTNGATILGVQKMPEEILRRCGVMIPEKTDGRYTKIKGLIEKPTAEIPSDLCSLGRFILTKDIFDELDKAPLKNGELYLTDAIASLAQKQPVYAYEFDGRRYDMGNKEGFLEATVEYALRSKELGEKFGTYLNRLKDNGGF